MHGSDFEIQDGSHDIVDDQNVTNGILKVVWLFGTCFLQIYNPEYYLIVDI